MTCRCALKKGRCLEHYDNCRVHCPICQPAPTKRKRGRPRKDSVEASRTTARRRTSRIAAPDVGSMREPNEHEGFVQDPPSTTVVSAIQAVWDGTVSSLGRFLRISRLRRNVPPVEVRKQGTKQSMRPDHWKSLVQAVSQVTRRVSLLFCPNDSNTLDQDVGLILAGGSNEIERQKALVECVYDFYTSSKKASIERRALCAVLATAMETRQAVVRVSRGTSAPMSNVMSSACFDRAKQDATSMKEGRALVKKTIRRTRFNHDLVEEALKFLLSEDFINVLSWGVKNVKLSANDVVMLPSLVRRKTRSDMFKEY